jgi:hypothetical protein
VAAYYVGAGRRLAFRSKRVVLGNGGVQVLRLVHSFGGPLVNAVGQAIGQIELPRNEMTGSNGGNREYQSRC